jgi:hypothetical protein
MLGLDTCGEVAAEGGTDEIILVRNSRTQRLLAQQLVGFTYNSVRFLKGYAQTVVTASADGSMKVGDISHQTCRKSVAMRHSLFKLFSDH